MRDFRLSLLFTVTCLILAGAWGFHDSGSLSGMWTSIILALILGVMEVSLSFDNAVVNASVLKEMDEKWQQLFLTVGIIIAVFGMRLLFPILIVATATGLGLLDVFSMALSHPDEYAGHLHASHTAIASFGGTFLFLVFLSFLFDEGKEIHWLGAIEHKLSTLGKIDSIGIIVALIVLLTLQHLIPVSPAEKSTILSAGITGLVLYVIVDSLGSFFESDDEETIVDTLKRNGIMSFLYLEVLDASFSFDGVIGAFAITRDVVIIMLGLAIGAMFVRSLTVFLVRRGALDEYIYLEHGAHYAIGALALIMFYSISTEVPEIVTGLTGVAFILAAFLSSVVYKNKNPATSES